MAEPQGQRDLVLAPNELAWISDETKGNINTYVGPYKASLSATDKPVVFNEKTKKFVRCSMEDAVQTFAIAPEGWYIKLKNPAKGNDAHPKVGTVSNLPELEIGRKVNITGPASFPVWPGQMYKVLKGHHLRSNQYLLVRVYDDAAARDNWGKAVIKKQEDGSTAPVPEMPKLTMGTLLIIQGTDVSFYIPPTGMEVVPDEANSYVRDAVTLERLEYCILLDEDGNKRFIPGPDVVFPKPTENFVIKDGKRKFKAIELNEISGLYIKVIADYEEGGKQYKVGDELFITGKEQMIYFPRQEHAIIKYADRTIHYAIAIPAGEARYVMNRLTGDISLRTGPDMFLADPRKEVIIRRVLDPKTVNLWFPGNTEALQYNAVLQDMVPAALSALSGSVSNYVSDSDVRLNAGKKSLNVWSAPAAAYNTPAIRGGKTTKPTEVGDSFDRQSGFTPPRTVTLDTKYEGAVSINVWTGYEVLVTSKTGKREVVVGPATRLLDYDEVLEAMELSTGNPKNSENLLKTVYLRVQNNQISDTIIAETKDLVKVNIKVSYRGDFTGDATKHFEVENYIKFVTDHLRSVIRNVVKQKGVEEFYSNNVAILRDSILGMQVEGKRPGKFFEDNGFRIKDVEILDVTIGDKDVNNMLMQAQRDAVKQAIDVGQAEENLAKTRRLEDVNRQLYDELFTTAKKKIEISAAQQLAQHTLEMEALQSEALKQQKEAQLQLERETTITEVNTRVLNRNKAAEEQSLTFEKERQDLALKTLAAEVQATVDKFKAVDPHLIEALQAFSDKDFAAKVATALGPLAIMDGDSVQNVLAKLVKGLPLGSIIEKLTGAKV